MRCVHFQVWVSVLNSTLSYFIQILSSLRRKYLSKIPTDTRAVPIRRNLTGNAFVNRNGMDTERVREYERNGNGTGAEEVQNGYRTGTEWIQNGYRTEMERIRNGYESRRWKKNVHHNANYKRARPAEHMLVSYAMRVLTKDLDMM